MYESRAACLLRVCSKFTPKLSYCPQLLAWSSRQKVDDDVVYTIICMGFIFERWFRFCFIPHTKLQIFSTHGSEGDKIALLKGFTK